jgi:ABC-type transporter Mla subunit MlaD
VNKIDIDELNSSVDEFKQIVDALSQIKAISADLGGVSGEVNKALEQMSAKNDSVIDSSERLAAAVDELKKESESQAEQLVKAAGEHDRQIEKMLNDHAAAMKKITSVIVQQNKQLCDKVQDYAVSTSGAIDELRIAGSDNAREIRGKIEDTEKRILSDLGRLLREIDILAEKTESQKSSIEKIGRSVTLSAVIIIIVSLIAAAVAAK